MAVPNNKAAKVVTNHQLTINTSTHGLREVKMSEINSFNSPPISASPLENRKKKSSYHSTNNKIPDETKYIAYFGENYNTDFRHSSSSNTINNILSNKLVENNNITISYINIKTDENTLIVPEKKVPALKLDNTYTIGKMHTLHGKKLWSFLLKVLTVLTTVASAYIVFSSAPLSTIIVVLSLCSISKGLNIAELIYHRKKKNAWFKTRICWHILTLPFLFLPFFKLFVGSGKATISLIDTISTEICRTTHMNIEVFINIIKTLCVIIYNSQEIYQLLQKVKFIKIKSSYKNWNTIPFFNDTTDQQRLLKIKNTNNNLSLTENKSQELIKSNKLNSDENKKSLSLPIFSNSSRDDNELHLIKYFIDNPTVTSQQYSPKKTAMNNEVSENIINGASKM